MILVLESVAIDMLRVTIILEIFRGSDCITLVTSIEESNKSTFKSFDFMAIIETIQLPKAVATKSVGENASPLP